MSARLLLLGDRVPQGSNRPAFGTISAEGGFHQVVLKFGFIEKRAALRDIFAEHFATVLAREVGLFAPKSWVVSVESHRAAVEEMAGWTLSTSFAVASSLQGSLVQTEEALALVEVEEAARLLVFDLLFLFSDRTMSNPNCASAGGRLFVFDFGGGFPPGNSNSSSYERLLYLGVRGCLNEHTFQLSATRSNDPRSAVEKALAEFRSCRFTASKQALDDLLASFESKGDPSLSREARLSCEQLLDYLSYVESTIQDEAGISASILRLI